jgi:hypothetical protein
LALNGTEASGSGAGPAFYRIQLPQPNRLVRATGSRDAKSKAEATIPPPCRQLKLSSRYGSLVAVKPFLPTQVPQFPVDSEFMAENHMKFWGAVLSVTAAVKSPQRP